MKRYKVIGVMSGTSLDGVDIAYCIFNNSYSKWSYEIREATTIPYKQEWKKRLRDLDKQDAFFYTQTHIQYGHYLGKLIKSFIKKHSLKVDMIASHGHTIFHQPKLKATSQIGDGSAIAAICKTPVICDFRSKDVALGGQGAPLVPIGDKLLFPEYTYCINLGGIANISFDKAQERLAFDICPVNMLLNYLSRQKGLEYDKDGNMAKAGEINILLLKELNNLSYFKEKIPKSLSRERIFQEFIPVLDKYTINVEDKLCTVCEHIATQIAKVIENNYSQKEILLTGGGAMNKYLVDKMKRHLKTTTIVLPNKKIISYKEALIFALLGILRIRNEVNCLKSVTGASRDTVGGAIYLGD